MKNNILKIWLKNLPAYGFISYASLIICIISGIILAIPFDIHSPFDSISLIIIRNQPALFFRSFHYWSAQLTFILTIIHIIDHLIKKSEKYISTGIWLRLSFAVIIMFYLMFSGFLLKSDSESLQALNIIISLTKSIPFIGSFLSSILFGNVNSFNNI